MSTAKNGGKLYEGIISSIRSMLSSGELRCGDRMPSERDLAEKFQVSRVPVREAMKILEYLGVLENVSGEGMYIRNISPADLIRKMDFTLITTSNAILDLFEVRISLEATATYYAALRRDDDDIAALRGSIQGMRRLLSSDSEESRIRETSHSFHTNVVRAAHNQVLASTYEGLFELLDISKQYTMQPDSDFDSLLAHEAILYKIIDGDPDAARESMVEHLESARRKLIRSIESMPAEVVPKAQEL